MAPDPAAQSYTFTFQDADIAQVAREILGQALGVNYSVDPGVTGKMSFRIDKHLTRVQLLEAFEAALAAQDVALVHQGDSLILEPPAKARQTAGLGGVSGIVHRAGYQLLAVPLTYATPSEVGKALESIAPPNTVVYTDDKLGLLVLSGAAQELQSILETVKLLDRDQFADAKIRWFTLNKAPAQAVATDLQKVADAASMGNVAIVALKRLNGILMLSRNTSSLDYLAKWIDRFDQASEDAGSGLWAYHPRNVSADALSHTLDTLLSGGLGGGDGASRGGTAGQAKSDRNSSSLAESAATSSTAHSAGATPGLGEAIASGEDQVRFSVDKDSNTLLVSAPASRWVSIQRVLAEIDKPPRQILIEASILEVTLTKDFHFGVDWSVLGSNGRLSLQNVENAAGTIAPVYPGFSATFLSGTVKAAITALGAHTEVEVVSAPKILALDNHPAKLEVGDEVPIITQSSQSTLSVGAPLVNSVDYRNTGVILNVTPRISGEDKVVLDISQEVSSVAQTSTSGIDSPTIQERHLESTLILQDGGVVALGGLISTNKTRNISGIPFIQNAPLIGALFRNDTRSLDRTELIVLLTATIMPDPGNVSHAMADLEADMKEMRLRGMIGGDPAGLAASPLRATPISVTPLSTSHAASRSVAVHPSSSASGNGP